MDKRKLAFTIAAVTVLIAGAIVCLVACLPRSTTPAQPVQPAPVQSHDCDDSDRVEGDVEDCGIGVLLDPRRTAKPPVKTTPKPKVTRR